MTLSLEILAKNVLFNTYYTLFLYYDVLYCTVLYCTVLYCTVLYCTFTCTVLYCTVLYCICNVKYYIWRFLEAKNPMKWYYGDGSLLLNLWFLFLLSVVMVLNLFSLGSAGHALLNIQIHYSASYFFIQFWENLFVGWLNDFIALQQGEKTVSPYNPIFKFYT